MSPQDLVDRLAGALQRWEHIDKCARLDAGMWEQTRYYRDRTLRDYRGACLGAAAAGLLTILMAGCTVAPTPTPPLPPPPPPPQASSKIAPAVAVDIDEPRLNLR